MSEPHHPIKGIKAIGQTHVSKASVEKALQEKRNNLPHIYGQKHYLWSRAFYNSTNKINLLCAANQIGKSTTAIKKNIEWACNKKLWPKLWPDPIPEPKMFWYFYPTAEIATIEFEKKWIPDYLPRNEMKNHEWYGWTSEYDSSGINAVHFRSGVSIYFKTYSQKIGNLQTSTVHMITGDEEMPEDFVDELMARLTNTRGYYNLVFTATSGYQLWYRAMECQGGAEEAYKTAFKQNVSLYDCMFYEDGTPGPWNEESIKERRDKCTSEAEVLKRVFGKFVKDEGRKYAAFSHDRNLTQQLPVPHDWRVYGGVDVGSGGVTASGGRRSSAAILFIAVNPDCTRGRIINSWRGDHQDTTAGDILQKYREMRKGYNLIQSCYDYQSREFGLIAARNGENFVSAEKKTGLGEHILNTLFRSVALTIDDGVADNAKLVTELMSIPAGEKNRRFQDDLCFSKNTPIYTARGLLPISCVAPDDMVLTRFGWQRVLRTSSRWAETFVFKLNNKRIACTEHHKFFSNGDFQAIGNLTTTQGTLTQSFWGYICQLRQHLLYLTESPTADTLKVKPDTFGCTTGLAVGTPKRGLVRFIEIFGNSITAISRIVMRFITSTKIHLTIVLKILSVCLWAITCVTTHRIATLTRCLAQRIKNFWTKYVLSQKSGMGPTREESGIARTLRKCGWRCHVLKRYVSYVAQDLLSKLLPQAARSFVPTSVNLRPDELLVWTLKRESVRFAGEGIAQISTLRENTARKLAVPKSGKREIVYNLTVENHPEYFASGFLVSNCDTLRYVAALVPWDFARISPDLSNLVTERTDPTIPQANWTDKEYTAWEIRMRRGEFEDAAGTGPEGEFQREIDAYNESYGS